MERTQEQIGDVIDLADIFRSLRNGWAMIAGSVAVGVVGALLVVWLVAPKFDGKASVLLKTGASAGGGSSLASAISSISEAAGGVSGGSMLSSIKGGTAETEIEILRSRTLASQLVDSFRLQAQVTKPRATPAILTFSELSLPAPFRARTYRFEPAASVNGVRQFRFTSKGDSGTARVGSTTALQVGAITLAPSAPAQGFTVVFRDRDDAITRTLEKLDFEKTKTDVVHFTYSGDDSLSAALVPNRLIELYLDRRVGVDRGVNQRTAEFLAEKVDSVARALTAAERALRAQREAAGPVDPIRVGEAEFENQNRIRQQLFDIQLQERVLQQLVAKIREGSSDVVQLASYPQYLGNSPIISIINNLIAVQTERQALLGTLTEEDERVKALATRARELESRLLPLAQSTLSTLVSQRTSLEQRVQSIDKSMDALPGAAESYGRLERDVVELGRIYAGLQVKLVDARLNAITEGGDVRALDLATIPKRPSSPKKGATLAGGLGAGLFVGLILAVLQGLVGGKMHDAQDVERRMGLPAVRFDTTAPLLVPGQSRTVLVAPVDSRARARPVAEQLVETALQRSLSATLLDLAGGNGTAVKRGQDRESGFDANAAIRRLEENHNLVVVELASLSSNEAAAVLDSGRPVILVAPERRIDRVRLQAAVDLIRRVGASCAGVVLHGDDRRSLRA